MRILIVYATKYGFTKKCAEKLAEGLAGQADICNIKSEVPPDLMHYDKLIIGGPIYAGKIRKEITRFCKKNLDTLKNKRIAFFICGMVEDNVQAQINTSFPKELLSVAITKEHFGGEYKFDKMNFIERFIVKKVSGSSNNVSNIITENIDKLAKTILNA
ncbi:MAG: flavodoxin [Firmicutes bacterium]|nr:flavodoxin [Bacillota bacterium]